MVEQADYKKLTGAQKCSIILMAVDPTNAARVYELLDDEEIKEVSQAMSSLGSIQPEVIERLIAEFCTEVSDAVSFVGNMDTTEKLLTKILGKDRVDFIMEDIRGPAGRNTWDKLGNVNEEILAAYLKNEYPQTVALIVSKITPSHAARVLSVLPDDFTFEVIQRMLDMDPVKKEVLDGIERTLRAEFISNLTKTQKYDSHEMMAEIFNNFDRSNESKFMGMLENRSPEIAEKIKNLMFTFDDLINIDTAGIQQLLRGIDKAQLGIALKGASETMRDLFVNNMSERAAKILVEDMEAMGPVRLRDVDEAQTAIVALAKDMASKGEIIIAETGGGEDDLIY